MTNVYNEIFTKIDKLEIQADTSKREFLNTLGYAFDRLDNVDIQSDRLEKYVMNLVLRIETLEEEVQSLKNFRSCYDPKFSPFHKPQDTK